MEFKTLGNQFKSINKGDRKDEKAFFQSVREISRNIIAKYIRNEQVVEDLCQDVVVNLLTYGKSFDGSRPFGPWFVSIARNTAFSYLRSNRNVLTTELDDSLSSPCVAYHRVQAKQVIGQIESVCSGLDSKVVVLNKILGYSHDEIASLCGITAGNSRVRAHRALRTLRSFEETKAVA